VLAGHAADDIDGASRWAERRCVGTSGACVCVCVRGSLSSSSRSAMGMSLEDAQARSCVLVVEPLSSLTSYDEILETVLGIVEGQVIHRFDFAKFRD